MVETLAREFEVSLLSNDERLRKRGVGWNIVADRIAPDGLGMTDDDLAAYKAITASLDKRTRRAFERRLSTPRFPTTVAQELDSGTAWNGPKADIPLSTMSGGKAAPTSFVQVVGEEQDLIAADTSSADRFQHILGGDLGGLEDRFGVKPAERKTRSDIECLMRGEMPI
jgi:hypothetical protein